MDVNEIRRKMNCSPWQAFVDRRHARMFSLNILIGNGEEVVELSRSVRDPSQGIRLMSENHRAAGRHAHLEMNRFVHNFVAAAKSLIDHRNVEMAEFYAGTVVEADYKAKIAAEFANEPLCKFVQRLRNYMLHKGLPESEMFLVFDNRPEGAEVPTIKTGIRYQTDVLKRWDGWTAPAKLYLESCGEYLYPDDFASSYMTKILELDDWLNGRMQEFHADDSKQFAKLQHLLATTQAELDKTRHPESIKNDIHLPDAADTTFLVKTEELDFLGSEIRAAIKVLNIPKKLQEFPSTRVAAAKIDQKDLIETPVIKTTTLLGEEALIFKLTERGFEGLAGDSLLRLQEMINMVSSSGSGKLLSEEYVTEICLKWLRTPSQEMAISQYLEQEASKAIKEQEVLFPIENLEIEMLLDLGFCQIVPIQALLFDELHNRSYSAPVEQHEDIAKGIAQLRQKFQGIAAVKFVCTAEARKAAESRRPLASDVVGILRFFLPFARRADVLCAVGPYGSNRVPQKAVLVFNTEGFMISEGVAHSNVANYRLTAEHVLRLSEGPIQIVAEILHTDMPNPFAVSVKNAVIALGNASAMASPVDRLIHSIFAVEQVLLENEVEQGRLKTARRVARLLSDNVEQRPAIEGRVRRAYNLRSRKLEQLSDIQSKNHIMEFIEIAHSVILNAISNVSYFGSVAAFSRAIEAR